MKTRSLILLSILTILFVSSCEQDYPNEELTMQRTEYTGDKLRFDGCYYGLFGNDNQYAIYNFYYRNGVIFHFSSKKGITSLNELKSIDEFRKNITNWSIYTISGDTMITQNWGESFGAYGLPVVTSYILMYNDTTIKVMKTVDSHYGTVIRDRITQLHFIKFYPRPDSTNIFIK